MPDSEPPALCYHCLLAIVAFARQARPGFSTFPFNEGEFKVHLLSPQWPMLRMNCSLPTGSFETQDEAHQLFCWFFLLVSVGQRNSVAGCE
jgi:hypothetical protein